MTDSEDDQEIPDHVSVARLNESSLICALAPVAALLGLNKIRKTVWSSLTLFIKSDCCHCSDHLIICWMVNQLTALPLGMSAEIN